MSDTLKDARQKGFAQGYDDSKEGVDLYTRVAPYEKHTREWGAWLTGYTQGKGSYVLDGAKLTRLSCQ